jgi:uncharacterized protein YneF (UPF0154 family)
MMTLGLVVIALLVGFAGGLWIAKAAPLDESKKQEPSKFNRPGTTGRGGQ